MKTLGARQYTLLKILMTECERSRCSTEFPSVPIRPQSVHRVLMNLLRQGLVGTSMSEPRHQRGGKARRLFEINVAGGKAVLRFEKESQG